MLKTIVCFFNKGYCIYLRGIYGKKEFVKINAVGIHIIKMKIQLHLGVVLMME